MKQGKKVKLCWGIAFIGSLFGVLSSNALETEASNGLGGPSHIGTFEGSTTFTTTSSNGINPGLYLEVMDEYGNYTEYTSEDGVITIPGTQEGAYVTQAKLLGKTKYRDQDTGELLDQWEAGRNLTLESVEKPALTTIGKNLMDINSRDVNSINYHGVTYSIDANGYYSIKGTLTSGGRWVNTFDLTKSDTWGNSTIITEDFMLKKGTYTLSVCDISGETSTPFRFIRLYKKPFTSVAELHNRTSTTFTLNEDTKLSMMFQTVNYNSGDSIDVKFKVQIEEGTQATPYEPFKSNILTVNEDVELRGIGDVKDELDLITGKVTERVLEYSITGDEGWAKHSTTNTFFTMDGIVKYSANKRNVISDKFIGRYVPSNTWLSNREICVFGSKIGIGFDGTLEELIEYLKLNNPRIFYVDEEKSIKTVSLNSTYDFQPVNTREILVEGSILPLICSVTTPTDPLSFVLNPNAEGEEQFIAPDFTITNQTKASVSVELKQFKQVTDVLNDVLPTKYADWSELNKTQSKDIALALVPQPSEGWEALVEGPRYVADDSNYKIGEIKAKSSVDFTFTAKHGSAFTQSLSPRYRLVMVFDF